MKQTTKSFFAWILCALMLVSALHLDSFVPVAEAKENETVDMSEYDGVAFIAIGGDAGEDWAQYSEPDYFYNNIEQTPVYFNFGETFELVVKNHNLTGVSWFLPVFASFIGGEEDDFTFDVTLYADGKKISSWSRNGDYYRDYWYLSNYNYSFALPGGYDENREENDVDADVFLNASEIKYSVKISERVENREYFIATANDSTNGRARLEVAPGESVCLQTKVRTNLNTDINYSWEEYDQYTNWDYVELEGQNAATLNIDNPRNGSQYRCTVSYYIDEYWSSTSTSFSVYVDNNLEIYALDDEGDNEYGYISVEPGADATLSVRVDAIDKNGLTYKWSFYDEEEDEWQDIQGANKNTYVAKGIEKYSQYYCYVSDKYGNSASANFYVSVDNKLQVSSDDGQTYSVYLSVDPGQKATLTANVSAIDTDGITYQWYNDSWEEISGANGSVYVTDAIIAPATYYCSVYDKYGNNATLYYNISVDNELSVSTSADEHVDSKSFYVNPGEKLTFTAYVSANDTSAIKYQWYEGEIKTVTDGDGEPYTNIEYEEIQGANKNVLTTDKISGKKSYFCQVSDQYGNWESAYYYVYIDNSLKVSANTKQSNTDYVNINPGESTTLTATVSAKDMTGITYNWYREEVISYTNEDQESYSWTEYKRIEGADTNTYTTGPLNTYGNYYCMVTDRYGNIEYAYFHVRIENGFEVRANDYYGNTAWVKVDPGTKATLTANVSAKDMTGITYRWYEVVEKTEEGSDYTWWDSVLIEGADTNVLVTENINKYHEYRCEVTDRYGNEDTAYFHVSIDNGLTVTANGNEYNSASITVDPGAKTTLTANVTAKDMSGMEYTWYVGEERNYIDNDGYTDTWYEMVPIEGADSDTYITDSIEKYTMYQCTVKDRYGNQETAYYYISVANDFSVTANDTDDTYITVYVKPGEGTTLTANVKAKDKTGVTYQWCKREERHNEYDDSYYWKYVPIEGATSPTFSLVKVEESNVYSCNVSDKYGNEESVHFDVRVDNGLVAYATTDSSYADIYVKPGESINLTTTVSATVTDGIKYQWYTSNNGIIPGETTAVLKLANINRTENYYCEVTDKFGNTATAYFYVSVINNLKIVDNDYELVDSRNSIYQIYVTEGTELTLKPVITADDPSGIGYCCYNYYSEVPSPMCDLDLTPVEIKTGKIERNKKLLFKASDKYGNYQYIRYEIFVINNLDVKVKGYNSNQVSMKVKPGEKVEIELEATADSGELSYNWDERGFWIGSYMADGRYLLDLSEDVIVSPGKVTVEKAEKSAVYECYVSDKYGNSRFVSVDVEIENNLKLEAVDGIALAKNEKGTLEAKVSADNTEGMFYTWFQGVPMGGSDWEWIQYREIEGADTSKLEITGTGVATKYILVVNDKYSNRVVHYFDVSVKSGKPVESITLISLNSTTYIENKTCYMVPGDSGYVVANILPFDAGNKAFSWSLSNEGIISVTNDSNELRIEALKPGKTKLTVTTADGKKKDTCEFIVEFKDVTKVVNPYYYNPVYWAVEKGITNGYTDDYGFYSTFGPQKDCTREQLMVFLYRLMGKPKVNMKESPFSDVKKGDYYYKAVLWAAENGITKGYGDGTFGVGQPISREDTVTFLYRAAGKPKVKATATSFSDVENEYYKNPIIWAAENGITKGNADGTFGVGENCLREHIVTFMYRYAKKIGKL